CCLPQCMSLLRLVAVDDPPRANYAPAESARARVGCAPVAELFVEHHLLVDRSAQSAVFLRPCRGNPAALSKLLVEAPGELEVRVSAVTKPGRPGFSVSPIVCDQKR